MCKNIKTLKSELVKAQKEYILAKAHNDNVKRIEEESKVKVLSENKFYTADHEEAGEKEQRILKSNGDYHMSESDFTKYCKLCLVEYLKNGLDVPNYNTTPNYKTSKELKQAENKIIKIGIDIIVIKENANREEYNKIANHWKYREELIDLILRLDL